MWATRGQSPGVSHGSQPWRKTLILRHRVCVRPCRSGRWSLVRLAVGTDSERGFGLIEFGLIALG